MRGIELEYPHRDVPDFGKILRGLPLENHQIVIPDSTIYRNGIEAARPQEVNWDSILNLSQKDALVLRMILQCFPKGAAICDISTYTDFLSSDCDFLFLVCDCYYIEIYSKKSSWLQQILENVQEIEGIKVSIKTDETDGRVRMYV